jgi:hypothetical protein
MARRRSPGPSLSLFAFQDIITGVAGVMLFILMLLVVQLAIQTSVTQASKEDISEEVSAQSDLLEQQARVANLMALLQRKQTEVQANTTKIDLLLDARLVNIDQELQARRDKLTKQQSAIENQRNQVRSLRSENEKLRGDDPAKAILEEIEKMKEEMRSLEEQMMEWQDETRVNYETDNKVKNLYLFDMQGSHCTMAVLPFDNRSKRIDFGRDSSAESIAEAMFLQYDKLTASRQDSQRRIVVLIRPSAASVAAELVRQLRNKGFEVAMELLEAKAELFRRPKRKSSNGDPLQTDEQNQEPRNANPQKTDPLTGNLPKT